MFCWFLLNFTAKFHFSEIVFWQSKLILHDISTKFTIIVVTFDFMIKPNLLNEIKKIFCP